MYRCGLMQLIWLGIISHKSHTLLAFVIKISNNVRMIRWLFILMIAPLCWGEASVQINENESALTEEQNVLVLVDLQGALFYPKTTGAKVASIQNQQVAIAIKNYQQQHGAKILYLAEHSSEAMFWQNSIKASNLPFENSFSLSNEIFHGFENSIPTCRAGVVLCQGQPLGEILGIVINELWIRTQFSPQKIIFYTANKERGEVASVIGLRIGALVEVNLVEGIIGTPPTPNAKELPKIKVATPVTVPLQQRKQKVITVSTSTKQQKKSNRVQVTTVNTKSELPKPELPKSEPPKETSKKLEVSPVESGNEPIKPEKKLPPVVIDETKLEYV